MEKTIDEIINRDDYARLTKELKNRTEEIAVKVRRKMNDLDLDEIYIEGLTLIVKEYSADHGQYHFDNLSIKRHCIDYYNDNISIYNSLSRFNHLRYACSSIKTLRPSRWTTL